MRPMSSLKERVHFWELAGLLSWLIKDFAWVLLIPGLAFPAAVIAIFLEVHTTFLRWSCVSTAEFVHGIAMGLWLTGNVVWMLAELLFDEDRGRGHHFLWFSGALQGAQLDQYAFGVCVAQGLFASGLLTLLVLYACWSVHLVRQGTTASPIMPVAGSQRETAEGGDEERGSVPESLVWGLVTPRVYQWAFVGPWLAKDFFWTQESLSCSLPFGLAAAALLVDCIRRFDGVEYVVELIWVVANIIWILAELALEDAYKWPRLVAGVLLIVDALLMVAVLLHALRAKGPNSEDSYLFRGSSRGRPS